MKYADHRPTLEVDFGVQIRQLQKTRFVEIYCVRWHAVDDNVVIPELLLKFRCGHCLIFVVMHDFNSGLISIFQIPRLTTGCIARLNEVFHFQEFIKVVLELQMSPMRILVIQP